MPNIWEKIPVVSGAIDTAVGLADSYFNRKQQNDAMHNSISYRVADARRAGIHPLAALGAATYSPRPIQTGTNFEKMGQSLSKLSPANSMHEKKVKELELEYLQEKTNNLRQQTATSKALATGTNNNNVPSLNPSAPISGISGQSSPRLAIAHKPGAGHRFIQNEIPTSSTTGIASGMPPLEQQYISNYGTVYKMPSEKANEPLSEGPIFTQAKYFFGQLADYFSGYPSYLWPKNNPQIMAVLKQSRPKNAGPGYEFRYNVFRGAWVLRKHNGNHQFWDHKRKPPRFKKPQFFPKAKGKSNIWNP